MECIDTYADCIPITEDRITIDLGRKVYGKVCDWEIYNTTSQTVFVNNFPIRANSSFGNGQSFDRECQKTKLNFRNIPTATSPEEGVFLWIKKQGDC